MSKPTSPPPLSPSSRPISLHFPPDCQGGKVAVITLNNPKSLNALKWEDCRRLIQVLEWIHEQPELLVTVLTAKGRYFSAGADVRDPSRQLPQEILRLPERTPEYQLEVDHHYASRINSGNGSLARALSGHSKILVGAINGPAVGICAAMLSHCDLLYTYDDFFLFTPFTSLALVAEGLSSLTFVRKMGLGKAQQALLQGRRMGSVELLESGFISQTFPKPSGLDLGGEEEEHSILNETLRIVRSTLLPPHANPFALLYTKRLLVKAAYHNLDLEQANQAELRGAEIVFRSGEPSKQFARLASGGRHKL
ncbi:ClpP/crotonase [Violaceomyces palustris]|uniref:ClpP/crotonase n=1 Tax=Violaceomyces palustris TaxID=1673888 RepID=A0ACD0P3H7_9BASI|nr:ClpP/crotonase [Violaceomyces palustris]